MRKIERLEVTMAEYQPLITGFATPLKQIGDGSIIRKFDNTPLQ